MDVKTFQESYFLGKLIWIKGPIGTQKIRFTYELLKVCNVSTTEVIQMNPRQFVDIFNSYASRAVLSYYRVVLIRGIDGTSGDILKNFSKILEQYRNFYFEFGLRFILVSHDDFDVQNSFDGDLFYRSNPVVLRISKTGHLSMDVDQRFHRLLEEACQLVGKTIFRISEETADFVEKRLLYEGDEEFLNVLIQGVQNSKKGTLTLPDLLGITIE